MGNKYKIPNKEININGKLYLLLEEIKLLELFKPINVNIIAIPNTTFKRSFSET